MHVSDSNLNNGLEQLPLWIHLFMPQLPWESCLILALAGATSGALAEAISLRIDDNFSVPLFSAGIVTITASLMGII